MKPKSNKSHSKSRANLYTQALRRIGAHLKCLFSCQAAMVFFILALAAHIEGVGQASLLFGLCAGALALYWAFMLILIYQREWVLHREEARLVYIFGIELALVAGFILNLLLHDSFFGFGSRLPGRVVLVYFGLYGGFCALKLIEAQLRPFKPYRLVSRDRLSALFRGRDQTRPDLKART